MFSRAVSALYTADTDDALGLFTLVSRVNFVGAMRNVDSQSGGGIFAEMICGESSAGYVTGDLVTRRASFVLTARFRSWVWART